MTKLFTLIVALTLVCVYTGRAQWTYAGSFPDSNYRGGSGAHGAAVDPDGKVWLALFGTSDSIESSPGVFTPVVVVSVFNPDGSPASFSPIRTITVGATTDTLYAARTNRGMRADADGNILLSSLDRLYKIDYKTGAGLAMAQDAGSITSAGVATQTKEVFTRRVVGANPIKIYDGDLNLLGNVVDTADGFSRTMEVSPDGNDVYSAGYTTHSIYKWHSDNGSFGPYVLQDTVLKGFDSESMGWNPTQTRLWASAGSANDRPNRFPGAETNYDLNTWYAWDPVSGAITDSIKWNFEFGTDSANIRPRAIAFSPDGNTAYVGCFGLSSYPAFQKFTLVTGVKPEEGVLPERFALSQNYPNPFNPSTQIKFSLVKAGETTLNVYNMLGQEVASLVNENLAPGSYSVTFDGRSLSSGTYMYTLTSAGQTISKKMLLVK